MENNQFVTDQELTTYINNSLSILDSILVTKFNDYKITFTFQTPFPKTNFLAIPGDFLKLNGVDIFLGDSDGYRTLTEYEFEERNKLNQTLNILGPYNIQYRLEGNVIRLIPSQSAPNYTYRIWYTPQFTNLTLSDALPYYMDTQAWHQYAIYDVAVKVLVKQDLDPSMFMAQANDLKEHIIKVASPNRNKGEPHSIIDTRGYNNSFGGYGFDW
jgi:hypothetical protein